MSPARRPKVAIVVATHERAGSLGALVAGIRRQTLAADEFEVVIVDDGSTDDTASVLEAERARGGIELRVIRRERPGGPAVAREAGWRAATAEVIAFTDDDCVPEPEWLARGLEALGGSEESFVQGWTFPPAEAASPPSGIAGAFTRTIRVTELDPAFQTCNVFYPRALLERVGGFATEHFGRDPGGEDSDLAWRVIEAGGEPVFCEGARVRHAVHRLGAAGKLRVAARWTGPLRVYALHPGLRRAHFTHRFFWKRSHYLLAKAAVATVLPSRLRFLAPWLAVPYLRDLLARGRVEGGGPLALPFFVLHDLVEVVAVVRAAVRYRTPML